MKSNYLLTENLTSTICVYLVLKKLMLPFSEWPSCKLGIIDKDGKKLKHPVSSKERESWDMLTRFCWNMKKITNKFIGKSNLAHNFVAALLLKDSLNDYIKVNQEKLNETLLSDMTFSKQSFIYNTLCDLDIELFHTQNEDQLEFEIYKHLNTVEKVLKNHPDFVNIFEDGEVGVAITGTTTSDIAQPMSILGGVGTKRIIKPKLKKKRKKYEN